MGAGYCHHSPKQFFWLSQPVITGIVLRTFRRYISTSGSSKLAIHRLSMSRCLAIRARVVCLLASPYTLLLALLSSSISFTIRTSRPILPPRLSVGGGRTVPIPVLSRGLHRPVFFHRSPRLLYIYGNVIPARASPARSSPVAAPNCSKGVVPSEVLVAVCSYSGRFRHKDVVLSF